MGFIFYDIVFLIAFSLFVIIFLYKRRKNLKREGLLFLYKTKVGIKFINYIGGKYKKTLKFFSYISIIVGIALMGSMIYFLGLIVYTYYKYPSIMGAIKVPPIMPLIPYLPELFKIDFLPPFYFTYWIIIIAIVAITHEFAHGIFAKYFNIKIKSTGFGFLGPFLAAFVEPDEKKMTKKSKFAQAAILSGGTFANFLSAILFFIVLWGFFSVFFIPSGITFDTYTYSMINTTNIHSINNIIIKNQTHDSLMNIISKEMGEKNWSNISINNKNYIVNKELLNIQKNISIGFIVIYDDSPAINNRLAGAISEINGIKIREIKDLEKELKKYSPGNKIKINTITETGEKKYELILGENPKNKNLAYLGIGFLEKKSSGIFGKIYSLSTLFKKENTYYKPRINSISIFIYNLLWWIILISFSVALVNMLPVGIFDGGRVFYLGALAIFKNENKAQKIFSAVSLLILLLFLILILLWVRSII